MEIAYMQEISDWFDYGCDYEAGVILYRRFGADPALLSLFEEQFTPFKQEVLEKALSALMEEPVPTTTQPAVNIRIAPDRIPLSFQSKTTVLKSYGWPEERDEYLQSLYDQWKPLFRQMKQLQHSVYEVALRDSKEAGRMAHKIMDLDASCEDIYQQRDSYLETGTIQNPDPVDEVVDPIKWPLMLQNAERYVRRYKTLVEKAPTDRKKIDLLKKYEQQVAHYRNLLKLD